MPLHRALRRQIGGISETDTSVAIVVSSSAALQARGCVQSHPGDSGSPRRNYRRAGANVERAGSYAGEQITELTFLGIGQLRVEPFRLPRGFAWRAGETPGPERPTRSGLLRLPALTPLADRLGLDREPNVVERRGSRLPPEALRAALNLIVRFRDTSPVSTDAANGVRNPQALGSRRELSGIAPAPALPPTER
jgi:hypothetical protein